MLSTLVFQFNIVAALRSKVLLQCGIGWMAAGYYAQAQYKQQTYCNPFNIDYGYTPIPNFSEWGGHRATADPVILTYKGDYYLFSTNQWGYWWSSDILNWKFISKKFLRLWNRGIYDELCAPVVGIIGNTMVLFGSTYTRNFTIWMLLNYKKPVIVSSTLASYYANKSVDENMKTYWSAASSNKGEFIQTDLGSVLTLNGVQINYADQDVDSSYLGKSLGVFYQYKLYYTIDGKNWNSLTDKSNNKMDVPHEYLELGKPLQARFVKLENVHMPTGKFVISGLLIFGNGGGIKPTVVENFIVLRTEKDKQSA